MDGAIVDYNGKNNPMYGKVHSETSRQKMSDSHKGHLPWNKGKPLSAEHKQHLSENHADFSGKNHPMYGKTHTNETKEQIRLTNKNKPPVSAASKEKMRLAKVGATRKPFSEAHKRKMRLAAIDRINKQFGQIIPNYNPKACQMIDEYGRQHDYNFQHAENGGEYHIKELGYWVDGYDKEKNVVIEYDELHHKRQTTKDVIREARIKEHLKCTFIRIGPMYGFYRIINH